MRRPSLVEEIKEKDVHYASTRIKSVLNAMADKDRHEVLLSYDRKSHQYKDKNFFLASLIDTFFDRKDRKDRTTTHHQTTTHQPTSQSLPPPPLSGSRLSAGSPSSFHSISAPTLIPNDDIRENRVCDYQFIKTLGKGTFGKVKLAEHILTKQLVAIKIIEKANIKTTKQKVSVDREVRLMKLLHHPHIVGVIDVFESDDFIWIVMEHAAGGELFDYIVKHGHVKENEARRFFRQILSAVEYCHQNSVIHRDLKPENLLLDNSLNIKIIDFGFGNTFHRDSLLDTYCGSPFYAAPEMIQGIRYIGPEVDVWSLGVILYALLSGKLPFDAASMNELYEKIAKVAVNLISRMLVTDPKKRATLAEIRQHMWVKEAHQNPIDSFVPDRPLTISTPNSESLMELVSYGFKEHEVVRLLKNEMNLHPIVSLYHLIDEARRRKTEDNARKNSLATISSVESVQVTSVPESKSTTSGSSGTSSLNNYFTRLTSKSRKTTSDIDPNATIGQQEVNRIANTLAAAKEPARPKRRSSNPTYVTSPTDFLDFSQEAGGFGLSPEKPMVSLSNVVATPEPRSSNRYQHLIFTKKNIREIFSEIERVLTLHRIMYAKSSAYSYTCDDNGCRFTIDVIDQSGNKSNGNEGHEVRFRKIHAFWSWNHKAIFGRLIKDLCLDQQVQQQSQASQQQQQGFFGEDQL